MLDVFTQLALILVVGFFLKELADRTKIPYIILLILAGTLLSTYGTISLKDMGDMPSMIRTVTLIIVVFSSAFYINVEELKKHSKSIIMLSTLGVLLTTLIITATTSYLLPIPIMAAALIGVLLSGTDAAVIATALPKKASRLAEVLRAESLFNSPFTVILPLLLLDFISVPQLALLNVPKLFLLIVIGAIVGGVGGIVGRKILESTAEKHTETLALAMAVATYVVAENLLGSGILAVAVCSILLNRGNYPTKSFLGEFNSELAFIATLFVFVLLGAQFQLKDLVFTRAEIFTVIVALLFARMFTVLVVLFRSEFSIMDRIKIGLIAPKGVSPAALAPLILLPTYAIVGADTVAKITYLGIVVSILFSLLVAKITVEPDTESEKTVRAVLEKHEERERKKAKAAVPA